MKLRPKLSELGNLSFHCFFFTIGSNITSLIMENRVYFDMSSSPIICFTVKNSSSTEFYDSYFILF